MKYSPKYQENLKKHFPAVKSSFDHLAQDTATAGPLSLREQRLVKLGIAIGIGSEGDTQNLAIQCLAEGMSPEELRHAVLLAITTAGFPTMIVAMQWVEEIIAGEGK